jgi:hypothetical protein
LSDLKPELEQFAVDPWRTQSGVSTFHPPDQHAQLCLDLRSSAQGATSNATSRESRPCASCPEGNGVDEHEGSDGRYRTLIFQQ